MNRIVPKAFPYIFEDLKKKIYLELFVDNNNILCPDIKQKLKSFKLKLRNLELSNLNLIFFTFFFFLNHKKHKIFTIFSLL